MSRNVAAHDSADESFAGLLEYLTSHAGQETAGPQSGPYFESRADRGLSSSMLSNALSSTVTGSRRGTRALLPVTEAKPGRNAATQGNSQLSYEKALRIHRRDGLAPANDLYPPKANSDSAIESSKSSNEPGTRVSVFHPSPPQDSAQSRPKTKGKKASTGSKKSSAIRQASINSPASSPEGAPSVSSNKIKAASLTRTEAAAKPESGSNSKRGPRTQQAARHSAIPETIAFESKMQPEGQLMQRIDLQLSRFAQLDQRRAIVSVRLTDGEFATLRNRADESGISVSAYIRSCVLEAESLRSQVKQALAEMRAFNEKPQPVGLPILAISGRTDREKGGSWLRLLSRSAALLLSPLSSFGRSV
jgi:hypothetical protein